MVYLVSPCNQYSINELDKFVYIFGSAPSMLMLYVVGGNDYVNKESVRALLCKS